jgi:hypothetical protein
VKSVNKLKREVKLPLPFLQKRRRLSLREEENHKTPRQPLLIPLKLK